MTKRKRIFTFIITFVILSCCIISAVIPAFAAVSFSESLYYYDAFQGSTIPYGQSSWMPFLADYYSSSNGTCYYFELQNTEVGGTRFYSDGNQFGLAYSFYQDGFGYGNPVYRFYVPYYDGDPEPGWSFQLRTYTGLIVFDSSNSTFTRSLLDNNVGYYQFEINRNAVGFTSGWYIYSDDQMPVPLGESTVFYNVQFQYYDPTGRFIGSRNVVKGASSEPVRVAVPSFPDFVIVDVAESYSDGVVTLERLTSDVSIRVDVVSYADALDDAYDRGFDRGKTEGRAEGVIQGYQEFRNSQEYAEALENAYDRGYDYAVETGSSSGYPAITNPLSFIMSPVTAFLRLEVFPGLQLGVTFLASIAVCLIIVFLKIFSGG